MIDLLIIGAIVGYAVYVGIKYFKKTKKGKCASCALENHCESNSCN